jgi:hypothetical protein
MRPAVVCERIRRDGGSVFRARHSGEPDSFVHEKCVGPGNPLFLASAIFMSICRAAPTAILVFEFDISTFFVKIAK